MLEQLVDHGGGLQHLLEVVEDQQRALVADLVLQVVEQRAIGTLLEQTDRVGRQGEDGLEVTALREIDEVDAVPEGVTDTAGDLERQPGLARAPRSQQGDQARLAEEVSRSAGAPDSSRRSW